MDGGHCPGCAGKWPARRVGHAPCPAPAPPVSRGRRPPPPTDVWARSAAEPWRWWVCHTWHTHSLSRGAPRGRALPARSARREARPTRATRSHALRGVKRPRYSRGERGSLITWRGQVVGAAVRGQTPCTWRDRGCFPGGRPCAPDPRSACRRLRGAEFGKRWCRAPRTHVPESAGLCVPPASAGSRDRPPPAQLSVTASLRQGARRKPPRTSGRRRGGRMVPSRR